MSVMLEVIRDSKGSHKSIQQQDRLSVLRSEYLKRFGTMIPGHVFRLPDLGGLIQQIEVALDSGVPIPELEADPASQQSEFLVGKLYY